MSERNAADPFEIPAKAQFREGRFRLAAVGAVPHRSRRRASVERRETTSHELKIDAAAAARGKGR